MQPFLKWAGGKRQLLPQIKPYIPALGESRYFEPFLGAGAMLFNIQPKYAVVNDINPELYNVYKVIADKHLFEELLADLRTHVNESDYFYEIRAWDRSDDYENLSSVKKASRFIFLNKTCFNGLYRVNRKGQFNAPFGKYKNPAIVNEIVLQDVHQYINNHELTFLNGNFKEAVKDAESGDFVYFDPPYDPVSETSSFTGYAQEGFGKSEQLELRDVFQELTERGCKVLLSNSDTPYIREIYEGFQIVTVQANRSINSKGSGRGKINEVLVLGN